MRRLAALLLLIFSLASLAADFDAFVVADIRLEGLTRIPAGTVFASFPIEKGDRVDRIRAAEAVRALFKTGFFNDIQVSRQGDILVLTLVERPAIAQIELWQNRDSGRYGNQVYILPKALDEKVARLHLGKLGAHLTRLTQKQADYIDVPIDGPYKPDYYRY